MTTESPDGPLIQLQLERFEASHPALSHVPVSLHLSGRRTLLFGRNGAGKSLLLESMETGARTAVGRQRKRSEERYFVFTFSGLASAAERLRYKIAWQDVEDSEHPDSIMTETADIVSGDSARRLWMVDQEQATGMGTDPILLPHGMGVLSLKYREEWSCPEQKALREFFRRVVRLPAGIPRVGARRFAFMERIEGRYSGPSGRRSVRLEHMVRTLVRWHESNNEMLGEVVAIGQRLNLFQSIEVDSMPVDRPERSTELIWVEVDHNDIGFASDGTLRALELLVALVSTPAGSLLLIEEPETAVHPGLLSGILKEIHAYTADKQAIISTHSPQVVSWAEPPDLRLVERAGSATTVTGLSPEKIGFASDYLCEDGSLGEFVFDGGIDDE